MRPLRNRGDGFASSHLGVKLSYIHMSRSRSFAALLAAALFLSACSVELEHELSERDANDIYVLLSKNGINTKKAKEEGGNEPTYLITVAKTDAAQALELLDKYNLPRPRPPTLEDIKKMSGMVPTAMQERAVFLSHLAGDITSALNKVDGVLEARAIVNIPENNDLTQEDKRPLPTASVFVKYHPNQEGRPPLDEERVRAFVAGAVPELRKEAVTVLLSEAQPPIIDVSADQRLQDIGGLRMTAESANRFKVMMGLTGLVVLALAGFTAYTILRGFGVGPFGRARTDEEAEE